MRTHIDLFSGIGGFALAARAAGFETIAFCEIDPYCRAVLRKHWPGVPIHEDIKTFKWPMAYSNDWGCSSELRKEISRGKEEAKADPQPGRGSHRGRGGNSLPSIQDPMRSRRLLWENEKQGDPGNKRNSGPGGRKRICEPERESRVTIITGGFPCQPFSTAGKRLGSLDDRNLWPHMFRVIEEVRPSWVVAENVPGLASMEQPESLFEVEDQADVEEDSLARFTIVLDSMCADLEGIGYRVQPIIIPACAVCATHRRDRVWLVAHSKSPGWDESKEPGRAGSRVGTSAWPGGAKQPPRPNGRKGRPKGLAASPREGGPARSRFISSESNLGLLADGLSAGLAGWCKWPEEPPEIPRVVAGFVDRANRLKALGNSIVPAVATEILRFIAVIENDILS